MTGRTSETWTNATVDEQEKALRLGYNDSYFGRVGTEYNPYTLEVLRLAWEEGRLLAETEHNPSHPLAAICTITHTLTKRPTGQGPTCPIG